MPITTIPFSARKSGPYMASAGQTEFPFAFPVMAEGDLTVWRERAGVATQLVLNTHYTVSGVAEQAGGAVTLTSGTLEGDIIAIDGTLRPERTATFIGGVPFKTRFIETDLDRLAVMVQELNREVGRSIHRAPLDARSGSLLLPRNVTETSLLALNAAGALIPVLPVDFGIGAITPFAASLLDDPDAAAARATLGIESVFNIRQYGAVGDGFADDTTAIQAAVNDAELAGGVVFIPVGKWVISDEITIDAPGVVIAGVGEPSDGGEGSAIYMTSGTAHAFNFTHPTGYIGAHLRDLLIQNFAPIRTSGAAIKVHNVGNFKAERIRILTTYNGVEIDMGVAGGCHLYNLDIAAVVNTGIQVNSTNLMNIQSCSVFQHDATLADGGDSALRITNGAGIRVSQFNTSNFTNGISIEPGNGQTVIDVWVSDTDMDSNVRNALRISTLGTTGEIRELYFSNNRYSFANDGGFTDGAGITIDGGDHITFLGGGVTKNCITGVRVFNGSNISFIGVDVLGNNVEDGAGGHGYDLIGGDGIQILGGKVGTFEDGAGNSDNQRYGINIRSSFTGALTIRDVDVRGNVTGGINNLSTSKLVSIFGCQGHILPWTLVPKTAFESRSNTATLVNDAALQFPMAANTNYQIRLKVWFDTTAGADFKYALIGPASPGLIRSVRRHIDPAAPTSLVVASEVGYPAFPINAGAGTTGGFLELELIVRNGANAGTFAFQWAQNTPDAGATVVLEGSYLEYRALN